MTDRAAAVTPTAAALVTAVTSRNATAIEAVLRGCDDLYALAVVLADNVGCIHDPALLPRQPDPRSRKPCVGCRRLTRSPVALCSSCRDVHASPHELTDGDWVTDPRDGVARWAPSRGVA